MNLSNLQAVNQKSIDQRASIGAYNTGKNACVHDPEFHQLKRTYPYCGFVEVNISDAQKFVMFSNNDDQVCQTYHFYGRDSFETYSMQLWVHYCKNSRVIFDIGAYSGVYTLAAYFSNPLSTIHAFEPIKKIYSRLIGNLYTNRIGQKITFNNVAMSDISGEVDMTVYMGDLAMSTGSSIIQKKYKDVISTEHVYCTTLDSYVDQNNIQNLDLIKIDAEQAEEMIFRGGHDFFKHNNPIMLIEVFGLWRMKLMIDMVNPQYEVFMIDEHNKELHKLDKANLDQETCLRGKYPNNYLWKLPD